MAGYKETPRQKMIAMMYLVLTALLALNVSKEILDAFLVVNDSIEVTNEKFAQKIDKVYSDFEKQYTLNPEKVKDEWDQAKSVRKRSRELVNYVDSLKYEMIAFTEKIPFSEAKVINLVDVKKKDNFDYPTNFFIGSDTKKGVAGPLRDSLTNYRTALLKYIDEARRPAYDERLGLKIIEGKGYKNASGTPIDWETYNFFHTIVAADVTIMNKIKAEIYNAESDIINYLYSSITEADFKFSGLSAKVIAKSNYVFQGGDYEAEVLVAAIDETQNPVVYYIEGADTMTHAQIEQATRIEGDKGSVSLTLPASREGSHKYAGIIEMKDPTGMDVYYGFKQEYIVAKPSATISPTKMNVFYRGVDNPVSISASGKADSQLDISISDGQIARTDTGWVVKDLPGEAYETTIRVYADDDGGKKFMGEQLFRIKSLPDPIARIIGATDDKISVQKMLANPFLYCTMPEYVDFEYNFKVTSFTMYIPQGGGYFVTEKSESQMFTDKMKSQIQALKKNDIVVFRDIKVRGPEGPRKIESINITIQ
ncbi:MAG: gliding motility protein GldM [Bacteroidales bacterium]|nr:gliding motility protein GldM [Bacteroidales bacterium]